MPPRRKSGHKNAVAPDTENATPAAPPTGPSTAQPATGQTQLNFQPRNQDGAAEPPKESPRVALHALSKVLNEKPATPIRRANSAGPGPPPSAFRSARRTPGQNLNVTPTNLPSARRAMPTTPHGRAAMREIELRRAAVNTPGKDRRRSGRVQRDSPRDLLRALSRVLAPQSKPIERTPQLPPPVRNRLNDMEDDPLPPRPRLSMPLGDADEDDDSLLLPPQSDGLLMDDDITRQSVEMPRRAVSEIPGGRLSRGSFGSVRMSDAFDQTGLGAFEDDGFDPSFVQAAFDDDEPMLDDPSGLDERTGTVNMRSAFDALRRQSGVERRDSDIRGEIPDDDTETFAFQIPQRDPEVLRAQAENARTGRRSMAVVTEEADEEDDDDDENEPFRERSRLEVEQDEEMEDAEAEEDNELEEEVEAEQEEEDAEGSGDDIEESEGEDDEDLDINRTANSTINRSGLPQMDESMDKSMDATMLSSRSATSGMKAAPGKRGRPPGVPTKKKTIRISKHGIQYPSMPAGVVKKLASTFGRVGGQNAKISKDTLAAIMQASDWFFEQVSEDLGAYAEHRGGKTIEESDVVALMRRQRQINEKTTPFMLAEKYLPRELLQDLRMVPPTKLRRGRKLDRVDEEEE